MKKQRFPATALAAATLLTIAGVGTHVRAQTSASVNQRRAQLNTMLDEEWQWEMRESPMSATVYGDYRYNDRLDDFSLAHQAQMTIDRKRFLAQLEAIDTAGFPEQDQLNQQLMVRRLNEHIEGYRLKTFEMPVDQRSGTQNLLAGFASIVPADSVKHYEDYIARLNAIPTATDQIVGVLRQGEKDRLMPPKFLLETVVVQCRSIAGPAGMQNVFVRPVAKFPGTITAADQQRLRE